MLYLNLIFIFLLGRLHFFLHFSFTFIENLFKKHPIPIRSFCIVRFPLCFRTYVLQCLSAMNICSLARFVIDRQSAYIDFIRFAPTVRRSRERVGHAERCGKQSYSSHFHEVFLFFSLLISFHISRNEFLKFRLR